jgi:hypothetical protein
MNAPASTLGRRPYQKFPARTARAGERGGLYGRNSNLSWGREANGSEKPRVVKARRGGEGHGTLGSFCTWRALAWFGALWRGLARLRKDAGAR